MVCVKLALAAVEATDCAIDGTVSCASLEDGRPALTGTAGVATDFTDGSVAVILMGATGDSALAMGTTTAGLPVFAIIVFTTSFALTLAVGLTVLAGAAFTALTNLATTLGVGLTSFPRPPAFTAALSAAAFLSGSLAWTADAGLAAALTAVLTAGLALATVFSLDLTLALATGLAAGLALPAGLVALAAVLAFPD